MSNPELIALGFRALWQSELEALPAGQFPARIARIERGHVLLWSATAAHEMELALYEPSHDLAVGDWLILRMEGEHVLPVKRLERFSCVSRRAAGDRADRQLIAANLDALFIVTSCNNDFSLERLERYLVIALDAGVTPVIVLTKADCSETPDFYTDQALRLGQDLAVVCLNALDTSDVSQLTAWCGPGHTVAMVGSSGVGKSTLTNQLIESSDDYQVTQQARDGDAKGRHTTTSRSLHRLQDGGLMIDTPGMRELQLPGCAEGVSALFKDVTTYLGQCKFNDCRHLAEPGCAVLAAIASGELEERRWISYEKLEREQATNQQGIADRDARAQAVTRHHKSTHNAARKNKGKRAR